MSWLSGTVLLLGVTGLVGTVTHSYHDYIVVGAGPGGLQVGNYLQKAGRDYIVLERGNVSGNFFTTFPRHDKLISINKRHTGKTNNEFNMRHDWNSLLSDDESLLYKYYSREMFPQRETMLKYLRDYTQRLNINVRYNVDVQNIHQISEDGDADSGADTREPARFMFTDQNENLYKCRTLIIATGLAKASIPVFRGSEYVEGYEDISVDPEDFEGQSVLILGRGNSAFEVADRIYGSTNLIHMIGRSRVRLSWATHYVGDLRAVNNALLDTYQLKSLDGVLEADLEEVKIVKIDGKLYLDIDVRNRNMAEGEVFDNFALRESYDRVIRCLGFTFDDSIFSNDTRVSRGKDRKTKYPLIGHDFQSADHPGLYYAGTVTHSLDHRFSSGGFIHGFRYTGRVLHRLLEWKNHGEPWPCSSGPIQQLLPTILKRINEASGPYQMFGVLGDVIILSSDHQSFEMCQEFPVALLHEFTQHTGRPASEVIVILLEYGPNFSGAGKDTFRLDRATGEPSEAHKSNFLHPVFYHYKQLPSFEEMQGLPPKHPLPRPDNIHHIVEDFLTTWDAPTSHVLPLRRFIENILKHDMRYFFADECFQMALMHGSVPFSCEKQLHSEELGLLEVADLQRVEENMLRNQGVGTLVQH